MQQTLVEVIENSLSAAQGALALLKETVQPQEAYVICDDCCDTCEQVEIVRAPTQPESTALSLDVAQLVAELEHDDYTLRTMNELTSQFGVPRHKLIGALEDSGYNIVLKHRRSDNAELIGLASRN